MSPSQLDSRLSWLCCRTEQLWGGEGWQGRTRSGCLSLPSSKVGREDACPHPVNFLLFSKASCSEASPCHRQCVSDCRRLRPCSCLTGHGRSGLLRKVTPWPLSSTSSASLRKHAAPHQHPLCLRASSSWPQAFSDAILWPVPDEAKSNVTDIACGGPGTSFALLANGTVVSWDSSGSLLQVCVESEAVVVTTAC